MPESTDTPDDQIEERVRRLEELGATLDERLLEQEHRPFALWRNLFRYASRPDGGTRKDLKQWERARRASRWALLWYFVQPAAVAAGAASVAAIAGLFLAYRANVLLRDQNTLIEQQNQYFRSQTAQLSEQITDTRAYNFHAQRAALASVIYARRDCSPAQRYEAPGARPGDAPVCPLQHDLRERVAATLALVALGRLRASGSSPPTGETIADLRALELPGVDLRRADFSYTDLRDADLSGSDLREANFEGALMLFANLRGAGLRDANFRCANLTNADLSDAETIWADFNFATLWGAKGDFFSGLGPYGALIDERTEVPKEFDPEPLKINTLGMPALRILFAPYQQNENCPGGPRALDAGPSDPSN